MDLCIHRSTSAFCIKYTLRFQKVVSATTQYLYYLWKLALDAMPEDEHIVVCSPTDQGFFRTVPKANCGVHWHLQLALETPVQAPYTRTWLRANPNCTSNMGPWPETTESRTGGAQWKAHLKHCVSISEPPTYPTAVYDPRFRIPCDYSSNANHDVKIILKHIRSVILLIFNF